MLNTGVIQINIDIVVLYCTTKLYLVKRKRMIYATCR
nr:MAG TPA_asm: hypothetical protein [Caudoviricetes sp.]